MTHHLCLRGSSLLPLRPPEPRSSDGHAASAFTLVEVLVVVVILGILAAIVVPQYASARSEVEQGAFINDIRIFSDAAQMYHHQTGQFLADAPSGSVPQDFGPYIEVHKWLNGTPIGGAWDVENNNLGYRSLLGVDFTNMANPGDTYMTRIDLKYDNGDLTTSSFQKLANDRYYKIVAQ